MQKWWKWYCSLNFVPTPIYIFLVFLQPSHDTQVCFDIIYLLQTPHFSKENTEGLNDTVSFSCKEENTPLLSSLFQPNPTKTNQNYNDTKSKTNKQKIV